MLDVLMKNGGHRIDYFESGAVNHSDAAALYIRADAPGETKYSRQAKHQLYKGLAIIAECIGFQKLVGIYVDVNALENVERPAYQRLKQDLLDGLFRRVMVIDPRAMLGHPAADDDVRDLFWSAGGFELINYESGHPVQMNIRNGLPSVAA